MCGVLCKRSVVGIQGSLVVPCHLLTDPQDLPGDVSEEYRYYHGGLGPVDYLELLVLSLGQHVYSTETLACVIVQRVG